MTPLTQQLEDKKKELELLNSYHIVIAGDVKVYCKECERMKVLQAEIAILEQAIAEMKKQRQEILEKIDKWRKDKFVSKYGERPNVMCDKYWEELKQQLNQPKEENEIHL